MMPAFYDQHAFCYFAAVLIRRPVLRFNGEWETVVLAVKHNKHIVGSRIEIVATEQCCFEIGERDARHLAVGVGEYHCLITVDCRYLGL